MTRRVALALVALMLVGCTGATIEVQPTPTLSISRPTSPPPTSDLGRMIAASVKIVALVEQDGQLVPSHTGSGTIISADGLIVTNAHVAAPDAPGLALQYGAIGGIGGPVAELHVLMTEAEDEPPVARYKASLVTVDGYLDIAVVRVTSTIDGGPVNGLDLPWLPIGDSDALRIGDSLVVVGFPGIGGNTVSADQGDVSGFLEDERIGSRGWIKTSAIVHSGNSGGLAANARGEIVGVPTRAPATKNAEDIGGFELLRPINLANPVIEAARGGQAYGPSPYFRPASGTEELEFLGWLREGSQTCGATDRVTSYPSGTGTIEAAFRWSGFTAGQDYGFHFLGRAAGTQTTRRLGFRIAAWERAESGDCLTLHFTPRTPIADGLYAVAVGAGPRLDVIAEAAVSVGGSGGPIGPTPTPTPAAPTPTPAGPTPTPTAGGPLQPGPDWIQLGGRIVDATTGLGIAGAGVLVFMPDVDPIAWANDPNRSESDVLARATSTADGTFVLDRTLPPTTALPLVITARDYSLFVGTLTTGTQSGSLGDVALSPVAP